VLHALVLFLADDVHDRI